MTELVRYLSLASTWMLPEWSEGPRGPTEAVLDGVAAAGYEGVQVFAGDQAASARAAGLDVHGIGRVDSIDDLAPFLDRWSDAGVSSVTVHLGTGFEDAGAGQRLVARFTELGDAAPFEVLLETHRATITQDPARMLGILGDHPQIRVTADLAHWYTGVEMTYGGFDWKVDALGPVFERTRLVHGRISETGCAQAALSEDFAPTWGDPDNPAIGVPVHVGHFAALWGAMFRAVLRSSDRPERLPFAPELLPPRSGYARAIPGPDGRLREDADRWVQARRLWAFAEQLFAEARAEVRSEQRTDPTAVGS